MIVQLISWRQLPGSSSDSRNPNGVQRSHQVEEIGIRVHAARILRAEHQRGEDSTERAQGDSQKSTLDSLADLHPSGVKSTRLRKEPLESNRLNHLWSTHRARKNSHPYQQEWTDLKNTGCSVESSEGCCLSSEAK